jgi:hypothetical protein
VTERLLPAHTLMPFRKWSPQLEERWELLVLVAEVIVPSDGLQSSGSWHSSWLGLQSFPNNMFMEKGYLMKHYVHMMFFCWYQNSVIGL